MYLIFVHANSRYIIIEATNLRTTVEKDVYEFIPHEYKSGDIWRATLKVVAEKYPIENLITDADRAFISGESKKLYQQLNIKHYPNNVSKEGHVRMGVLDRVVRTIRDLVYNADLDETNYNDIKRVVTIYNNTKHKTLSKYLGAPTAPKTVFEDEELEQRFIRSMRAENWSITHKPGYLLAPGTEVVVKRFYDNPFDKRRGTAEDDTYVVIGHEGQKYTIENPKTKEQKVVFRSTIKRVPKQWDTSKWAYYEQLNRPFKLYER